MHDVFYSEDDFSGEDDVNSSDEDLDEEDIRLMLITINENNIAPHFKDMALAMKNRDVNELQIAIDNFTGDIDEYSIDGETALHYACLCCSRKSFEILVGRGANMEAKNKNGAIPLHTACNNGSFNIVEFIFNNISDGDIKKRMLFSVDNVGSTLMHKAAGCENINIVKLLLDFAKEIDNSAGISKMIQAIDIVSELDESARESTFEIFMMDNESRFYGESKRVDDSSNMFALLFFVAKGETFDIGKLRRGEFCSRKI
ncbi:ankyrin repeat domain-containing protein EMB506, chloroplastic-like [Impatiens glandulifera]|uniref:ankyrin repeat domain-containing protein EMB506, chloroplastic-like n=1 Tax=Impatiens glandulifera TaxID=253017 RepID=UPI001FB11276|nr:ankyrin repeat domain-containing protein EMB506, chloroplastic-like [Impatiens glandulifera]